MSDLPFRAALFDLDGTLLDSGGLWREVDRRFFGARGLPVPEDFARETAGLSFRGCASRVRRRWLPGAEEGALLREWFDLAEEGYAERVPPIPGAVPALRRLKRRGIRLIAVTSLPERLFAPALARLGLEELFEACFSEFEEGAEKADGELYRRCARRSGLAPEECAVFDDEPRALRGARLAGMRAWAVRLGGDGAYPGADRVLDDYGELLPGERDPRCVVFTAWCEGDPRRFYAPEPEDFVLCADGGWPLAVGCGVKPDLVIGDFDSAEAPDGLPVQIHPAMKDDTDTMLCLREGLRRGYGRFLLVGGMGGRLDHTLANLQSLCFAARRGASAEMIDGRTHCRLLTGGARLTLAPRPGYLSLFSLSDVCRGLDIDGAAYELHGGRLTNAFPLGVSNAFREGAVTISLEEGMLLVMSESGPPD